MPCYYTGTKEGDRALAAEESADKLAKTITKLTRLLCEAVELIDSGRGEIRLERCSKELQKFAVKHKKQDKQKGGKK